MAALSAAANRELEIAPAQARAERHEFTLVLTGRCRACAELLPRGTLMRRAPCPRCHEPTVLDERDRALVVEHLAHRANVRVGLLATAIGLSHLLVGWVPIASSLVIAASTAWIRFQIVQPVARILTPSRARVAIWTARMATSALVAATLIVNELVTLLPFVGALAKGLIASGEVLLVAWANARYMRWQIDRDEDGLAVGWWEYAILVGSFGLLVASATGLVAASIAVVLAAQSVADKLIH